MVSPLNLCLQHTSHLLILAIIVLLGLFCKKLQVSFAKEPYVLGFNPCMEYALRLVINALKVSAFNLCLEYTYVNRALRSSKRALRSRKRALHPRKQAIYSAFNLCLEYT